MAKRPYPAWRRRHAAVLVWLLQYPHRKLYDCAAETGYSPTHVSRIINAPEFRRRYTEVREAAFREAYFRGMLGPRKRDQG